jgi:hypothetical protein
LTLFEQVYKPLVDEWYIGSARTRDFALANMLRDEWLTPKLEVLLEAARRANWDALHGPRHLRSGRFRPMPHEDAESAGRAGRQGVATDGAARR